MAAMLLFDVLQNVYFKALGGGHIYYHAVYIRPITHTKWHCDTPTPGCTFTVLLLQTQCILGDLQRHDIDTTFCEN